MNNIIIKDKELRNIDALLRTKNPQLIYNYIKDGNHESDEILIKELIKIGNIEYLYKTAIIVDKKYLERIIFYVYGTNNMFYLTEFVVNFETERTKQIVDKILNTNDINIITDFIYSSIRNRRNKLIDYNYITHKLMTFDYGEPLILILASLKFAYNISDDEIPIDEITDYIIESTNPNCIINLAKISNSYNLKKLTNAIINLDNIYYTLEFLKEVDNCDKKLLIECIYGEINDERMTYYEDLYGDENIPNIHYFEMEAFDKGFVKTFYEYQGKISKEEIAQFLLISAQNDLFNQTVYNIYYPFLIGKEMEDEYMLDDLYFKYIYKNGRTIQHTNDNKKL